jgi:hypothetical protein
MDWEGQRWLTWINVWIKNINIIIYLFLKNQSYLTLTKFFFFLKKKSNGFLTRVLSRVDPGS